MLRSFISFSQENPGPLLTFRVDIAPNSVNALKVAHFAGGEPSLVESTPNMTFVHRHVIQRAFGIKLTVIRPGNDHCVMIHEDDLNLPLTFDPDTSQPNVSPAE